MMKKILFVFLFGAIMNAQNRNVGINTTTPHPSSILEVSADLPPTSTSTSASKKGLLIPRVALKSSIDVATIPNPAKGLLVINTANAGTYPDIVSANEFYFWDGAKWERISFKNVLDDAVKSRVFYVESSATQTFLPSDLNFTVQPPKENVVTFPSAPILNVQNIITKNADNTFTVNVEGLYDFSAFINYNPMNGSTNSRAFINMKIQISTNGGTTWTNSNALTRAAWGYNDSGYLKTVTISSFPLVLQAGTRFRLTFTNPFIDTTNHGNNGNPYIGTNTHLPVAKGLKVQLLDFNL